MKHYHHLTEVERYQIEVHLRAGMNFAGIAIHMDRPRSCISKRSPDAATRRNPGFKQAT